MSPLRQQRPGEAHLGVPDDSSRLTRPRHDLLRQDRALRYAALLHRKVMPQGRRLMAQRT